MTIKTNKTYRLSEQCIKELTLIKSHYALSGITAAIEFTSHMEVRRIKQEEDVWTDTLTLDRQITITKHDNGGLIWKDLNGNFHIRENQGEEEDEIDIRQMVWIYNMVKDTSKRWAEELEEIIRSTHGDDFFNAYEETRNNDNVDSTEAMDYALTIRCLAAGDDPFSDDEQYRLWQIWAEDNDLEGWPTI